LSKPDKKADEAIAGFGEFLGKQHPQEKHTDNVSVKMAEHVHETANHIVKIWVQLWQDANRLHEHSRL
jgi:hypothetical protein